MYCPTPPGCPAGTTLPIPQQQECDRKGGSHPPSKKTSLGPFSVALGRRVWEVSRGMVFSHGVSWCGSGVSMLYRQGHLPSPESQTRPKSSIHICIYAYDLEELVLRALSLSLSIHPREAYLLAIGAVFRLKLTINYTPDR